MARTSKRKAKKSKSKVKKTKRAILLRKKKGKSAAKKSAMRRVVAKKTAKKVSQQAKLKAKTLVDQTGGRSRACAQAGVARTVHGAYATTEPADGGSQLHRGQCRCPRRLPHRYRGRFRRRRLRRHSAPHHGQRRSRRPRRWAVSVPRIPGRSRTSNPPAKAPASSFRHNGRAQRPAMMFFDGTLVRVTPACRGPRWRIGLHRPHGPNSISGLSSMAIGLNSLRFSRNSRRRNWLWRLTIF